MHSDKYTLYIVIVMATLQVQYRNHSIRSVVIRQAYIMNEVHEHLLCETTLRVL